MISTTGRSSSYEGNGVQTVFEFPNALIEGDHLVVTIDDSIQTAYTVVLYPDRDLGATVTFATAPAAATTVVIKRVTPLTQLVDYTPGDRFNAETHENALDKLTLIQQETDDDHIRSFKAPDGTSTITKATTSMYGKYLALDASGNLVGLDETVGSGTGSNFDMSDASDVDLVTTNASGTTTIAIPNASTPLFGAQVTVDAGAGTYSHTIKMPAPGTSGQRAFLRIRWSTAHDATITIKDQNDATLVILSGTSKHYATDVRLVSAGGTWGVDNIQRGEFCVDRFHGVTYIIPANAANDGSWPELFAAVADVNPAVIYLNDVLALSFLPITIPERHTLVVAAGAGFDCGTYFGIGGSGLILDCEVITALDDQAIFFNADIGSVRGKFGGLPVNTAWFSGLTGANLTAYPDDWHPLQNAVLAADWQADGTPVTVTNWNASTDVITVADTNNIAEGDAVTLQGTLGDTIEIDRLLWVVSSTSGAGTTLSTFKLALSPGGTAIGFGTGGSLAATVTKMKCQRPHKVLLNRSTYTIDRPIVWAGSGATLVGSDSKITAIAGEWATRLIDVDTFAGDHSPMLVIGQNDPEPWDNQPCGVQDITLDGGGIANVSGIGAQGHIPRRSRLSGVVMVNISNHYLGWAENWTARPGYAQTSDTSYLTAVNLDLRSMNPFGVVDPIPLHCPGTRFSLTGAHISGLGSTAVIVYGVSPGATFRDIDWDGALAFGAIISDAGRGAFLAAADTTITAADAIFLDEATGNEAALTLNYTTNKATSGVDTGLEIGKTDTDSPGVSYLMTGKVAGSIIYSVQDTGHVTIGTSAPNTQTNAIMTVRGDIRSTIGESGQACNYIGYESGTNSIVDFCTGMGYRALYLGSGSSSTAFGHNAGSGNGGNSSSFFGRFCGASNTKTNATGVGYITLRDNTGNNRLQQSAYAALNTNSGDDCSALGYSALQSNTGDDCAAVGYESLMSNTGDDNTAIGYRSGRYQTGGTTALTDANTSVFIGFTTKGVAAAANQIVIGSGAESLGANTCVLGNASIVTTALRGAVGIGTTSPNANAALDVTSTTKAFLPPRMSTAQKNALASPTAGMMVYDSTLNALAVYTGGAWASAGGGGGGAFDADANTLITPSTAIVLDQDTGNEVGADARLHDQ